MYLSPGPMLVWNGEKSLATVTTNAGEWRHPDGWRTRPKKEPYAGGELQNMFDELPNTFWHSGARFENGPKKVKIQFKVGLI